MDDLLPRDVWVLVCAHLPFDDATRLLSTCRAGLDDTFYWSLAVETHGAGFWARALRRRTRHVFTSMRDELRTLFLFEERLRAERLPRWSVEDYYRWWDAEASYLALPKLRVNVREDVGYREGRCARQRLAEVGHAVVVGLPRQLREHAPVVG